LGRRISEQGMSDQEKHEWDRLTGESSKAYAHFCLYRDMGQGRSLRKLAADAKTTSKLRQLQHWSSRWKWVERCEKYDDFLEHQDRLRRERERREMNERQAKIGVLGQNLAVKGVEKLLAEVQSGEKNLGAAELARLLDVSAKLERLSRGQPTDSHEISGPGGGPVRLGLEETLKRIDEVYGLKTEEGAGKQLSSGGGSDTSDS